MVEARRGGLEALFEPTPTPRRSWIGAPNDAVLARLDMLAAEVRELRPVVHAFSSGGVERGPLAAEGLGPSVGTVARTGITQSVAMTRKFTAETLAVAAALLRR